MGRTIDADKLMDVIREHEYPLRSHYNSTDNGMFTTGIQQAVDEAPTVEPQPQWISVKDGLPTKNDADRFGLIIAYSKSRDQATLCKWWYVLDDETTTHWMPLPQPPKEDADA